MPPSRQMQLLLSKARQDEYVVDKFVRDPDAPDEVYGFHAQQAAEKLLKAILVQAGIEVPRSHRIAETRSTGRADGTARVLAVHVAVGRMTELCSRGGAEGRSHMSTRIGSNALEHSMMHSRPSACRKGLL